MSKQLVGSPFIYTCANLASTLPMEDASFAEESYDRHLSATNAWKIPHARLYVATWDGWMETLKSLTAGKVGEVHVEEFVRECRRKAEESEPSLEFDSSWIVPYVARFGKKPDRAAEAFTGA